MCVYDSPPSLLLDIGRGLCANPSEDDGEAQCPDYPRIGTTGGKSGRDRSGRGRRSSSCVDDRSPSTSGSCGFRCPVPFDPRHCLGAVGRLLHRGRQHRSRRRLHARRLPTAAVKARTCDLLQADCWPGPPPQPRSRGEYPERRGAPPGQEPTGGAEPPVGGSSDRDQPYAVTGRGADRPPVGASGRRSRHVRHRSRVPPSKPVPSGGTRSVAGRAARRPPGIEHRGRAGHRRSCPPDRGGASPTPSRAQLVTAALEDRGSPCDMSPHAPAPLGRRPRPPSRPHPGWAWPPYRAGAGPDRYGGSGARRGATAGRDLPPGGRARGGWWPDRADRSTGGGATALACRFRMRDAGVGVFVAVPGVGGPHRGRCAVGEVSSVPAIVP